MYLYLTGTLELPDAFDTHSLSKDFTGSFHGIKEVSKLCNKIFASNTDQPVALFYMSPDWRLKMDFQTRQSMH